ncbi:MAG: integration host factor subunit alpha [Thermodesulfobacteriota bacterium]
MTLTKEQIVDDVQDQIGFHRKKSAELVETLLEIMKRSLENGEDVLISGFGKFCVKQKAERKGRNPATGKDMMLAKRKVVTFKCSSVLRNRVSGDTRA